MLTTRDEPQGALDHGQFAGAPAPLSLPVCPFAHEGLDSRLPPRCPGFAPEPLSFAGLGAGESLGERVSCAHLGTQRGPRGYVSACRHPGGCPPGAEALATGLRRRRARVAAH
jgi:hypothetical protein